MSSSLVTRVQTISPKVLGLLLVNSFWNDARRNYLSVFSMSHRHKEVGLEAGGMMSSDRDTFRDDLSLSGTGCLMTNPGNQHLSFGCGIQRSASNV